MTLRILPDAELLALTALRADPDWAGLAATAGTEIPADTTYPHVVIRRIGGSPRIRGWHDSARLQIDVYADTKPAARLVAATVQAILHNAEATSHTEGVIGAVDTLSGPRWITDLTTRQPRYIVDMSLDTHPPR